MRLYKSYIYIKIVKVIYTNLYTSYVKIYITILAGLSFACGTDEASVVNV